MKKIRWLYAGILCFAICILGAGISTIHGLASSVGAESRTSLNGLVTAEDGYLYYYVNGKMQTGWTEINGKTYYFRKKSSTTPRGSALTGLKKIGDCRYYFSSEGVLQTGWAEIDGHRYYFRKSAASGHKGAAATGLIKIGDYRYYFTSSGKMCTGWKTVNGCRYYFKKAGDGVIRGSAVTGLKKISGNQYYFSSSGVLQTNTIAGTESEGYYYVDDNGQVISTKAICQAVDFVIAHA